MGYYYDIREDLEKYPNAWCICVVGGRNTGKTYSALRYTYEEKKKHVFIKRTQEDVDLLCAGSGENKKAIFDVSPYKALNRDFGWNVGALKIFKGLGGFYDRDDEGTPTGAPIGYCTALSVVHKVKGYDLSECEFLIWDEFIPQPWERVNYSNEGKQIMDLFKTVERDRYHRTGKPLTLVALANATKLANPLFNVLEITDIVATMDDTKESYTYIEDRGILIHMLSDNDAFRETERHSPVYQAMKNTEWGRMAFENTFAYDDTSNVELVNLKGYRPIFKLIYKEKEYYCYTNEGQYYITDSKTNKKLPSYDMAKENDQRRFYSDRVVDLREACANDRVLFKFYSIYDLIIRFKNYFKV